MTWDEYFLNMLEAVAAKSNDQSSQHGAIIVDDKNRIIATGYNGFPRGVKHEGRQERPEKYHWIEHAERNAIYCAPRSCEGGTLYVDFFPCSDCARAIIQTGITRVVVSEQSGRANVKGSDVQKAERWKDSQEIAKQMFREAGVDFGERGCARCGKNMEGEWAIICVDNKRYCRDCVIQ